MRIAVIGLGKLGSVIAAVYAAAGHEVVGFDINPGSVADVNRGVAPVCEPDLQDLIDLAGSNLKATTDVRFALMDADASYIIVPTPSDRDGTFINRYVLEALHEIGRSLRSKEKRHTVVICSTVMPGSCDGELTTALELSSGKVVGQSVGLVYSPEFIALGSIVRDMQNPDMILIGESDPESGAIAEMNALSVARNLPIVHRMKLVDAEITKIAINTFVTTKISFANMLGEICHRVQGSDVNVVTAAVGADSRIGGKYLKAALGYGGPCFPRDNVALSSFAETLGVDASIPRATDAINNRQASRVLELVAQGTAPNGTVAVLGLSYKPDTSVCERSQGVQIANLLAESGYKVVAHDPQADISDAPDLALEVQISTNLSNVIACSATVVIATAWADYQYLTGAQLHEKLIIDPWGVLDSEIQSAQPSAPPKFSEKVHTYYKEHA